MAKWFETSGSSGSTRGISFQFSSVLPTFVSKSMTKDRALRAGVDAVGFPAVANT